MRQLILAGLSSLVLYMLAGCSTYTAGTAGDGGYKRLIESELEVSATTPVHPFDFREFTLDNGLHVITMEDFSSPIVAVHVWYHVGSKDEDPDRQGFAHMFEHMMFRGTDLLGPDDHFNLIRSVGGTNNAYTHFDYTAYVNTVPADQLDLALWLEAERMMFLDISQEGFETERRVVEEERREYYLNVPYGTLPERVLAVVCKVHPYRWLPIGRISHLEAAGLDELRRFWDTYYVPNNATLVIVGAIPHERARQAVNRYFGWMPNLPEPPKVTVREPEQTEERTVTLKEPLGPVPAAGYAWRTVARSHPDSIPLEMTLRILAGGESSRLYKDLVRERKLCVVIRSEEFTLEQDGAMGIVGAVHPIKYVLGMLNPFRGPHDAVFAAFDQHIETLQRDGVTDHELIKAKNQMLKSAATDLCTVNSKADKLGESWVMYGDPDRLNRRIDDIASVTRDDIRRVARKYLTKNRRTAVKVVPKKRYKYDPNEGTEIGGYVRTDRVFAKTGIERPVRFPATPPIGNTTCGLPEVVAEETVLANGLKVVVIPDTEVPLTAVVLGLKHGAWTETRPAVASMAIDMLTRGTENYTADELADIIEFNALDLVGHTTMDMAKLEVVGLSDKLPLAIELLSELVLRPTFPRHELKLLKRQRKVELAELEKDPGHVAWNEYFRHVFGDHPYARYPLGRKKDIRHVRRDDVVDWWSTSARPETAVLYVAGDVTVEEAVALAEHHFGAWEVAGPMSEVDVPPLPVRRDTHIYLVDNPGAVQSEIRIGQVSLGIDHPDYYKAAMVGHIFGGSYGSRLNKTIRIERGLTYGARGGYSFRRFTGQFIAATSTKTAATGQTVEAVLAVIDDMRSTPPTYDELTSARSYLVGRLPARYETPLQTVNEKWHIEYIGLPGDDLHRSVAEYNDTRTGDIVRIAAEYIDPGKLTVVVVGDVKRVRKDLENIAPVTVVR